jgi:predicted transcriptional regulator YdeE
MNLATGIQKAIDYIEAYPDGDMTSPDYKSQIWIPVVGE